MNLVTHDDAHGVWRKSKLLPIHPTIFGCPTSRGFREVGDDPATRFTLTRVEIMRLDEMSFYAGIVAWERRGTGWR